jgi:ABC-type transport system substrate-binding protein
LVPLFISAPDDGNTIDNKGIHHAKPFSSARVGSPFLSGAFSAWAADTPVKGGTLIYLEQQPHTNLYPPAGGFYPNGGILNQITDKLTWQNPKTLAVEPWIAESWVTNADKTEYTFTLRPGITFSDGTPLDANAVAKNFDTYGLGNKAHRLPVSEVINNYDHSEVINPLTVKFYFKNRRQDSCRVPPPLAPGWSLSAPCSVISTNSATRAILSAPGPLSLKMKSRVAS